MGRRIAVIGDYTTTGGRIISGNRRVVSDGSAVAVLGDKTTCPKCKSMGTIIEGAQTWIVDGKPAAYDGCIVVCGCRPAGNNRVIATKSRMFVDVQVTSMSNAGNNQTTHSATTNAKKQGVNTFSDSRWEEEEEEVDVDVNAGSKIREDARKLIECAQELCDKHLYYPETKSEFMQDTTTFATTIVNDVESGQISYEEGSQKLKQQEKDFWAESWEWFNRGLNVLGGTGLILGGIALCTTGVGCVIGGYLATHGANNIYEGATGNDGFLKEVYRQGAKQLGMSETIGDIAYDLVDLGLSAHGKLKLLPKIDKTFEINEFNKHNSTVFKLFSYGRKDLERAYKQMGRFMLNVGILSDVLSMRELVNNAFIKDEESGETSLVVKEPETIKNVGEIIDSCTYIILITGEKNPKNLGYYRCTRPNGEQYKEYDDGSIEEHEK